MQALQLLFTSDVGLFTVAVFVVMLAMVGYFSWLSAFKTDTTASGQ